MSEEIINYSGPIVFSVGHNDLIIPSEPRFFDRDGRKSRLPVANFGVVVPNKLFRGSWPHHDVTWMKTYGIEKVFSLWNDQDPDKIANLPLLRSSLTNIGIEQLTLSLDSPESYFKAAEQVASNNSVKYIHCLWGANRTSMVTLLTQLLSNKNQGLVPNLNEVVNLLKDSLFYGFDFDKDQYTGLMEILLKTSLERGLWRIK